MFDQYPGDSGSLCGPGSFFPGPFGTIITRLFWGTVILLVVKAVSNLFNRTAGPRRSGSNAMELLRERYAGGEINRTEFERMNHDLA